ncbi:hypothetical protein ACP6H1_28785 [Vibrio harveyi]|uniref:hypothetical protein n=1 Tax=Vibrio harveyi TaxID=669 RepID=UPI003CF52A28
MIKITISCLLFFCVSASHATEIYTTKITTLMLDKKYAHQVYIKTSKPHVSGSPECHASSWSFVLKIDTDQSETMYSVLLAAYMAGKTVNLIGSDTCNSHNGIEDLRRIEISSNA